MQGCAAGNRESENSILPRISSLIGGEFRAVFNKNEGRKPGMRANLQPRFPEARLLGCAVAELRCLRTNEAATG